MSSEPVFSLPNFDKTFKVHTYASDVAIGGVLVQEGHPIVYKSRKLLDRERRYPTHEKEMAAVVHCLKTWKHYLLGRHFTMYTDNILPKNLPSVTLASSSLLHCRYSVLHRLHALYCTHMNPCTLIGDWPTRPLLRTSTAAPNIPYLVMGAFI